MKNIYRFFMGIGAAVLIFIAAALVALLLSPLVLAGTALFGIITAAAIVIFVIAGFFTFIWYMSRKEPEIEKHKKYSVEQGKQV